MKTNIYDVFISAYVEVMNEQYPQQDEPSSETQDLEANIEAQSVTHDQGGAKKVVEKVVNEGII